MPYIAPLNPLLKPRNGTLLRVVIVARISTEHQDLKSLEDQAAKCRAYLGQYYEGKIDFDVISSRGSGEHLDREELRTLEARIESRCYDLVIAEDLGRICRRNRAMDLCELCQDCDMRLIAINDRVDTAVDCWQDSAHIATWHHERSNRDTADRIRRTLNNRFDHGGVVQFVQFGYFKPEGAKNDAEIVKDPEVEHIIPEIFRRLEQGASFAEVADWLNEQGIAPGPCCRLSRWDAQMVRRWVHNSVLMGVRIRNRMVSKRHHKTGRHRSVKADPQQLRTRNCAHLAYFNADYYDHVIRSLAERNAGCSRAANGRPDPRLGVSRKRTKFPGQHAICGICGRLMHWHGMQGEQVMLCSGASDYKCWNGWYMHGGDAACRIAAAVWEAVSSMPSFDDVFGELVRAEAADFERGQNSERESLERRLRDVQTRLRNVMGSIELSPESKALHERLKELEAEQSQLSHSLSVVQQRPPLVVELPAADRLREEALAALQDLATDDQETCRLLRQLIPQLVFMPYRTVDDSDIVLRAEMTVMLAPLLPPELGRHPKAIKAFTRRLVVTIGSLAQPHQNAPAAGALQAQGLSQRQIGAELKMAQSATQRAIKIHSQMQKLGLGEPFLRVTELPESTHRMRRHRHPRFRFEPQDGFPLME